MLWVNRTGFAPDWQTLMDQIRVHTTNFLLRVGSLSQDMSKQEYSKTLPRVVTQDEFETFH